LTDSETTFIYSLLITSAASSDYELRVLFKSQSEVSPLARRALAKAKTSKGANLYSINISEPTGQCSSKGMQARD
ncbi:hypothetical protein, partial [Streptomyces sp. DT9]